MKFTTAFSNILLVSVLAVSNAKAVSRATLDVWSPRITSPDSTTVWKAGQVETVTWDVSNAPAHISNRASVVFHNDVTHAAGNVLASDFDLRSGNVSVTVPADGAGFAHITLFGDSGNDSQTFIVL